MSDDERDLKEARKVLLDQAKALDLEVDGRWSVDTLAEKVLEAQEAQKEADKAAFDAARKILVRLKKDAWPLEDERCRAGEVIEVPLELARHWIANGVAERADPLPDL